MKNAILMVLLLAAEVALAGEVRYLAAAGDDAADGRTPQTAWRTVKKLNSAMTEGMQIRLRCGDVFYGGIKLPAGRSEGEPTVLTSWGEGAKPVVKAVKVLKMDPACWEGRNYDCWRFNLQDSTKATGLDSADANPGFLLVDGEVKAWRKFCRFDVNRQWDFAGEGGYLYVYSTENPAKLAKSIEVALNVGCVQFRSHTVISNLAFQATGGHGACCGWTSRIDEDILIADCDFENIGGSELIGFDRTGRRRVRYGNGIEFGSNSRKAVVERCTFRGVYDVAVTMQGYPKSTSWSDIHFRNCTMTDCTQAFEVWCQQAPKGLGFERCSFTGNRTLRVGGGWGAEVRPNRQCATPLLVYMMDTDTVDIDVSGNTFENCPRGLIYKAGGIETLPAGYRIHDNIEK